MPSKPKKPETHPGKARQRNSTISPERTQIEALLRRLTDGQTISAREIAERVKISPKRCESFLQSMRQNNQATNKGPGKWCATQQEKQNQSQATKTAAGAAAPQRNRQGFIAHPDDPICNGNRENGSLSYWQTYQTRLMAPARQPAGK